MPTGILDVLASSITTVGASDFTANAAVADVAVNNVPANGLPFFSPFGSSKFALGDNLLIRKIWAVIPWGFGQGGIAVTTFLHVIGLNYWDGAALTVIPPFPSDIVIPTLCDPLDFGDGLFAAMPTTGALRQIRLTDLRLRVSQINLPAILDGTRIPVQYMIEVLHTKAMSI